ncbi:MAG: hypothetical protein M0R46_02185 [Candidatus Muirbacterium halophilum]|nr:hypothetical protein [Candidatus Muirbacterium halophilum]MCK9474698.1 hypothetical protein [Candidatus Muirbacterium halophilum]
MIFLYDFFITILLSIILIPLLAYLYKTDKLCFFKHYAVFYKVEKENVNLFHCVSVGEANAVLNLAVMFKEKFIISTTCRETFEYINKRDNNIKCVMYPVDLSFFVKRFLKVNCVKRIFISEVDYWPNLFFQAKKLYIPIYIVNARMSQNTYRFFNIFGSFCKNMFSDLKSVYVQNKDEIKNFKKFISINKIKYYGNLKFENNYLNCKKLISEKIIIGGSTHWPEEKFLIDYCQEKKLKLILAPRNFNNNNKIIDYIKSKNLNFSFYSKEKLNNNIILIDVFGILQDIYRECTVAYIGGGFKKTGVHNFIEALKTGIPVVIGPNTKNFKNEYEELKKTQAVKKIKEMNFIGKGFDEILDLSINSNLNNKLAFFFEKHSKISYKIAMDIINE